MVRALLKQAHAKARWQRQMASGTVACRRAPPRVPGVGRTPRQDGKIQKGPRLPASARRPRAPEVDDEDAVEPNPRREGPWCRTDIQPDAFRRRSAARPCRNSSAPSPPVTREPPSTGMAAGSMPCAAAEIAGAWKRKKYAPRAEGGPARNGREHRNLAAWVTHVYCPLGTAR